MAMKDKVDFAFLVHPRDITDIYRKYPFVKYVPDKIVEFIFKLMPPIIVSKPKGLKDKDGNFINGLILSVSATAKQMMEDRKFAQKKILQTVKFAEKRGAKIIGLGALTASLTKGGLDLIGKTSAGITTGRVYTTISVTENVSRVAEKLNLDLNKITLAIVGAAGGIGSACAGVLAKKGIKNFIFVDLERKKSLMNELVQDIRKMGYNNEASFKISSDVNDIYPADIIIAATNASDVVIRAKDLKKGAVVINDAQPSDISPDIFKKREDVLIIEGGIINTPGIRYNFDFGLAAKDNTFSCLGEVMILAFAKWNYNYATGFLDLNLIEDISKYLDNMNFKIAEFQNSFEGIISDEKINKIKNIISNNKTNAD